MVNEKKLRIKNVGNKEMKTNNKVSNKEFASPCAKLIAPSEPSLFQPMLCKNR